MTDSNRSSSAAPAGAPRRKFLIGILVLLGVGLVYDFTVARPAVEAAYDQVSERNQEFNAERKHQAMLDHDIQEILGFPPDRTFADQGMHVEVYSWQAGLPFRSHDLYCVYRPINGQNFFVRLTKFAHDPHRHYETTFSEGEALQLPPRGRVPGGSDGPPWGPPGTARRPPTPDDAVGEQPDDATDAAEASEADSPAPEMAAKDAAAEAGAAEEQAADEAVPDDVDSPENTP